MNNLVLKLECYVSKNYWTNSVGISRSLLALSTFLTLLLNSKTVLFYSGVNSDQKPNIDNIGLNLYTWFPNIDYGYFISLAILIVVIIGVYPKVTCVLHWLVTYSFLNTSTIADGGDQITTIITLLLIPICLFDKRTWHWSSKIYKSSFYSKSITALFYLLIRIQVFIIYFFASIGKFRVDEWKSGTAMYYWLTEPLFGAKAVFNPLLNIIFSSPIFLAIVTWGVLIFELLLAFTLFTNNKSITTFFLISGIAFHFGILLFFGLFSFFLTMTACLILFLNSKNFNYEYNNFNILNSFRSRFSVFSFSTKKN